jgi:flavin-dependent dehydrogenase
MADHDAIVVGAGPAGCIAAIVLARAGVRVRMLDRSRFPRRKLCGDTLNPGARALLDRLGLAHAVERGGLPVAGMVVSGAGVTIEGLYPQGMTGLALTRADFDARLVEAAARAGAGIDEGILVTDPVLSGSGSVTAVRTARRGGGRGIERARVFVAADGRHSTLAFKLGLARHPASPRRWAIGSYFTDVQRVEQWGEMHVREDYYVGVARVPDGLVNACLVTADRGRLRDPERALREVLERDPLLRDRFAQARRVAPVATLGPLAVDANAAGMRGLLLAGDAAGFVDPMTGDGLRFAMRGGELAARAALHALATGDSDAYHRLARWRGEFRRKRTFNRALRALVDSPRAVRLAAAGARLVPSTLRFIIDVAGDVRAA